GAYDITIELVRCAPELHEPDEVRPLHTGFEVKYKGPDTDEEIVPLPRHRLFVDEKDAPLGHGLDEEVSGAPKLFLDALYVSSLRDIRRTYQRAFKAALFARRFDLSARPFADYAQSEIG